MNVQINTPLLERIIAKNGGDKQLDIAVEELSELTKEIIKFKRGKGDPINIAEEIADVLIMIEQIKQICRVREDDVDRWIHCKTEYIRGMLREVSR